MDSLLVSLLSSLPYYHTFHSKLFELSIFKFTLSIFDATFQLVHTAPYERTMHCIVSELKYTMHTSNVAYCLCSKDSSKLFNKCVLGMGRV